MWAPLGTLVIRYRTGLAACQRLCAGGCALVVTTLAVVCPPTAAAQRVDGAIGVALTILPPTPRRTVEISSFGIDRDGTATIRTAVSAASHTAGVIMARVSDAENDLATAPYVRAVPCDSLRTAGIPVLRAIGHSLGMTAARSPRLRSGSECEATIDYRVDVGHSASGAVPRDVLLHMELLVVAGT